LRIMREETIKLKLDICGERSPVVYPYIETPQREQGERFSGDCVKYVINGKEYSNIYGITIQVKKVSGTKTELWIRRSLENGTDIPEVIEEIAITAYLQRDKYEHRQYGTFRITIKRLVLVSDETNIDSVGAVIGPLRYYVAGEIKAEVFESGERLPMSNEQ